MNDFLFILLSSFAVFRLSYMIINESGPLNVFGKTRNYIVKRFKSKDGGIRDLFSCIYCLSVYISIIPSIYVANNILELLVYTLSISALTIIIYHALEYIGD